MSISINTKIVQIIGDNYPEMREKLERSLKEENINNAESQRSVKEEKKINFEGMLPYPPNNQIASFQARIQPYIDNIRVSNAEEIDKVKTILQNFKAILDDRTILKDLKPETIRDDINQLVQFYDETDDDYPINPNYPESQEYCKGVKTLIQIRVARKVHEFATMDLEQKNDYVLKQKLALEEKAKMTTESLKNRPKISTIAAKSPLPPHWEDQLGEMLPDTMTFENLKAIIQDLRERRISLSKIFSYPTDRMQAFVEGYGNYDPETEFFDGHLYYLMFQGFTFESIMEPINPKPSNLAMHNPLWVIQHAELINDILEKDKNIHTQKVKELKEQIDSIYAALREFEREKNAISQSMDINDTVEQHKADINKKITEGRAQIEVLNNKIEEENKKLLSCAHLQMIPETDLTFNLTKIDQIVAFREHGASIKALLKLEPTILDYITEGNEFEKFQQLFSNGLKAESLLFLSSSEIANLARNHALQNRTYFDKLGNISNYCADIELSPEVIKVLPREMFNAILEGNRLSQAQINFLKRLQADKLGLESFGGLREEIKLAVIQHNQFLLRYLDAGFSSSVLFDICSGGVEVINKLIQEYCIAQTQEVLNLRIPSELLVSILKTDPPMPYGDTFRLPSLTNIINICTPQMRANNTFVGVSDEQMRLMFRFPNQLNLLLTWGCKIQEIKEVAHWIELIEVGDRVLINAGVPLKILLEIRQNNPVLIANNNFDFILGIINRITRDVFVNLYEDKQKEFILGAQFLRLYTHYEIQMLTFQDASTIKLSVDYVNEIIRYLREFNLPLNAILDALKEAPKNSLGLITNPTFFIDIDRLLAKLSENHFNLSQQNMSPILLRDILLNAYVIVEFGSSTASFRAVFKTLTDHPEFIRFSNGYRTNARQVNDLLKWGLDYNNIFELFKAPEILSTVYKVFSSQRENATKLSNLGLNNLQIIAIINDPYAQAWQFGESARKIRGILDKINYKVLRELDPRIVKYIFNSPESFEYLTTQFRGRREQFLKLTGEEYEVFNWFYVQIKDLFIELNNQNHFDTFFGLSQKKRLFILNNATTVLKLVSARVDFNEIIKTKSKTLLNIFKGSERFIQRLQNGESWPALRTAYAPAIVIIGQKRKIK